MKVGDEGEPQNLAQLLDELASEKPFLFRQGATVSATSATNGQRNKENRGQTFSRSQLRDPAFFRANENEIRAAVREGRIREE